MKHYILLLILSFTGFLYAQETDHSNLDDLHNRKWEFIVQKSQLSSQEAARVKPFFLEYEKAVWTLMEKNKEFFRDFYRNKENRSEAQYLEMNERYVNSEIQKAHLLKNYYTKLKKQLSAESIFKYFNAERSFRKELMDKWSDRPKGHRK
jgi:hypothetical protein